MLSIGKLGAGGRTERYYTQAVAQGREDYYSGKGEAPGRWVGAGAASLGLSNEVDADDLGTLLRGVNPKGGELRSMSQDGAVSGFDVALHAPKSVSILFGIGDERVATATREAHDLAVGQAIAYLERAACRTRRGKGGVQRVRGRGFVAAAFRHRTSRAGDPQLHTHVVIGNMAEGPDGRWTALDGRLLYKHGKTAGYLYQAALRAELTERLGVRWTEVTRGTAEIAGVPRSVIDHFSQRRAEIVALMKRRGEHSARAAQIATLETRRRKDYDVPVDRLREEWRARAAEQGLDSEQLAQLLHRAQPMPEDRLALARVAADLADVDGLTRDDSTFDRRHVLQAWAEKHPDGAPVTEIERLADAWLASPAAVRVEGEARDPECPLYSTPDMLVVEEQLVELATKQRGVGAGQVSDATVDCTLAERSDLSEEQAALVRQLTGSGDGVQVVRAAAGTGKTYALDAARTAWEADGHRVIGCALSARAAAELRDQSGIQATTIARLLGGLEHGYGFDDSTVLVMDEAGMVGTRAIATIAAHAALARAKLVLVGDDRQLPEIEAGGAFRGLAARLGAVELREVRRQREEWDREALNALREGDVEGWSKRYREHGRVVSAPDAQATRSALVADWWRHQRDAQEKKVVMIALRRVDVAELNERARAAMRAAGRLGPDELDTPRATLAAGDRVVAERNDRRLGLTNGTLATVERVDKDRRTVTLRTDDGRTIEPTSTYVTEGHLAPAYALTAHKAQGMTVDRAFVLGSEELYREWGYTALSRHREEARFYVSAPADQPALPGLEPHEDAVAQELDRTLGRSRAKEMATDVLARAGAREKSSSAERLKKAELAQRVLRDAARPARTVARDSADVPAAEQAEAAARLAETQRRRAELPKWRRRERAELDRQIVLQERAVEHWRDRSSPAKSPPKGPRVEDRRQTAAGPERLARQAADRARLVELLVRPEPPDVGIEPPDYDTGLEL